MLATLVEACTFMYDIASRNKVLVKLFHDHLKVVFIVFLLKLKLTEYLFSFTSHHLDKCTHLNLAVFFVKLRG